MSVRVSFAGREIMRLPDELIEPFQELCDAIGSTPCRRDRAGQELIIASPLEGRAIGLLAPPGDAAAAEVVAGLRERLSQAGALVREVPGDVCVAFRSRPRTPSGRSRIRVLHGLRGFSAHRRLAAMLAKYVSETPGSKPALSLSAGRWLGRWGGWQRPSALVEFTAREAGAGLRKNCVRGTFHALLRYFAGYEPSVGPAEQKEPMGRVTVPATPEPEREVAAPPKMVRIIRSTGGARPHPFLFPPGVGIGVTFRPDVEAPAPVYPIVAATADSGPAPAVNEQPASGTPEAAPVPVSEARQTKAPPPSTGTHGSWAHGRQPWFTGRWGSDVPPSRMIGRRRKG